MMCQEKTRNDTIRQDQTQYNKTRFLFKITTMRKEVNLNDDTIKKLKKKAEKMGLKLKNYLEYVLTALANSK